MPLIAEYVCLPHIPNPNRYQKVPAMQNERLVVAPHFERGVYLEDVTYDGYVGYKVVASNGVMLLRNSIHESTVDSDTEARLWNWLNIKDPVATNHLRLVSD
jgi:hypothetical protein